MMVIKNYSRHNLNRDQMELLKILFSDTEFGVTDPLKPFFSDSEQLFNEINNTVSILVAPFDLVLESMAMGLNVDLITFRADQTARAKGYFATKSAKVIRIKNGKIVEIMEVSIPEITVWTDFRTGESCEPKVDSE